MSEPRLVYSRREAKARWAEASDRDLLEALRVEDELALDELIRRKTAPLLQVVRRYLHDAEEARDVVQVAFLRLWQHRDRYDQRWSPNTWIYRIATNLAIDQLRSRQSKARQREPYRAHLRQLTGGVDDRGARDLQHQEVHAIFDELSRDLTEKQRLAFVLREVEGLSSAEAAAIMDCRESTVRNHLFNARKRLQVMIRERYPEYARLAGKGRAR